MLSNFIIRHTKTILFLSLTAKDVWANGQFNGDKGDKIELSFLVQQPVGFTRWPPKVQTGLEGLGRDQHTVRLLARTGEVSFITFGLLWVGRTANNVFSRVLCLNKDILKLVF